MAESGADLFDAPDRSTLVELTLFSDERGSGAFENPDMVVGGLFADDGGDHSGQAAEFNVEDIINGLTRGASYAEGHFPGGFYGDADQPRLCGWRDKGKFVSGVDERKFNRRLGGKPFDDVGRKIQVVFADFSVFGVRGNLPGDRVNEDVNRFGEGRPTLNMVVADQAKDSALRKDCYLVIK